MANSSPDESTSGNCPRCQEWKLYRDRCQCQLFEVAEPYNGDVPDKHWNTIYAEGAEDAAERFAEQSDLDSAEYRIVRAGSAEIWTRDSDGNVQKWNITAEAVPTYHAREKL